MRRGSVLPVVVLGLAGLGARGAVAGEEVPRGPPFGDNAYRTEIRGGGESGGDVDDFAGPLLRGERLRVVVRVPRSSALRPQVRLRGPDGAERPARVRVSRSGRRVRVGPVVADRSGGWAVSVAGAAGTEGAYAVAFRVARAPREPARVHVLGNGEPLEAAVPFEGVAGAHLSFVARAVEGSALPQVTELSDGAAAALTVPEGALAARGGRLRAADVPLTGASGTHRLLLGIEEGSARFRLRVVVRPPPRPRGRAALDPDEPRLARRSAPLEGAPGEVVRLEGARFSAAPLPMAFVAGAPAPVVAVTHHGTVLHLVAPAGTEGALADVEVVNPDGQGDRLPQALRFVDPRPLAPTALAPTSAALWTGGRRRLLVTLSRPAPSVGASAAVRVEPPELGTVPELLLLPPGATTAGFDFVAGDEPGTGRVVVELGERVEASVEILARPVPGEPDPPPPEPAEIDLSGWLVVQTSSNRSFRLPEGTRLREGGLVLVGRKASRGSFESFWGVTLDPEVIYLDSADTFPSVNGQETFALQRPDGTWADGATVPAEAGSNYQRVGEDAGSAAAWRVGAAVAGVATPGAHAEAGEPLRGARITEFSDASGLGNWIYEFVELRWLEEGP